MTNYVSKTGKHLVQILMFSMYNDQRIIYREYIQNAYDAINRAVKDGILQTVKDGFVQVKIDEYNRNVTITDNGCGIPSDQVEPTLLDIADSKKDGIKTAGQYGIGRLAGAGYCQWLRFKTSAQGENVATTISFDVDFANRLINDSRNLYSATEIIDAITTIERVPEVEDSHYFSVELEGVYSEYKNLLSPKDVIDYLREVAPIDYAPEFKRSLLNPSLLGCDDMSFQQLYKQVGCVKVSVNDEDDIRKRYGLRIEGTDDKIEFLDFFKVENDSRDLLAWGWYAVTPFTRQIPIQDYSRGIRLRKHNIQIGYSDTLNKYFGETRSNYYFYGEIFVVHPNLRPNSDRSGLAPTLESEELFSKLRVLCKGLDSLHRLANDAKNAVKKVVLASNKYFSGIDSDYGYAETEINSAEQEVNIVENRAKSRAARRVIELYKEKFKERKDKLKNSQEGFSRLKETGRVETVSAGTDVSLPNSADSGLFPKDLLEPLKEKFTNKEIILIRRTFLYLTQNCPDEQRELLEKLKKQAVIQLSKL
jgi:molecular chaperone HtpG